MFFKNKQAKILPGEIRLYNTIAKKNKVNFEYEVSKELTELFDNSTSFFYEYLFDFDFSHISESILNIPFVMNLMPLIWISNSVLYVKKLDLNFYHSLDQIKQGFKKVYPKAKFGGKLVVERLEDNNYVTNDKQTIFFTGGVDATASLINNLRKNLQPFYILGADVELSDTDNIFAAERDVSESARKFGYKCNFIKSSIRFFYDGIKITKTFEYILKDSWWHGAQHSIGMLSLLAPYAFYSKINTCIIAASFTKSAEGKINCVSFPFIDNALCFGSTKCYHDGYEMSRQDKVNLIAEYVKKEKLSITLRVCFSPKGGINCNYCEKCLRTILALKAAYADPNDYGFKNVNSDIYSYAHEYLKNHFLYHTAHWEAIRDEFRKNRDFWKNDSDVSWILNFKFNSLKLMLTVLKNKIKQIVGIRK